MMRQGERAWLRVGLATVFILGCIIASGPASAGLSGGAFFLRPRDVVAFLGDSITERGRFICYLDEYLLSQCPDYRVEFINAGWGGDRATFGGEGSHSPGALGRLDRDVLSHHPTVVAVMLGMNDGREGARDPKRLALFREGIRQIVRRIHRQSSARVVLMTTTPYDPSRVADANPAAAASVARFARAVQDVGRKEGAMVVDLHGPMADLMSERRRRDSTFTLMPDGMHLNTAGHLMVSHLLLSAWRAPIPVRQLTLRARARQMEARGCEVRMRPAGSGVLRFDRRLEHLPMAVDERARATLQAATDVRQLSSDLLVVRELSAPAYDLCVDDRPLGVFSRERLAAGVDLSLCEGAPDGAQARGLSQLAQYRFRLQHDAWLTRQLQIGIPESPQPATMRQRIADGLRGLLQPPTAFAKSAPTARPVPPDLPERLARLDQACCAAAVPRWHHFELIAVH